MYVIAGRGGKQALNPQTTESLWHLPYFKALNVNSIRFRSYTQPQHGVMLVLCLCASASNSCQHRRRYHINGIHSYHGGAYSSDSK